MPAPFATDRDAADDPTMGLARRRHYTNTAAQRDNLGAGMVVVQDTGREPVIVGGADMPLAAVPHVARVTPEHSSGVIDDRRGVPVGMWATEAMRMGYAPQDDDVGRAVPKRPVRKMVAPPQALQQRQVRMDQGRLFGAGTRAAREFFMAEPSENHAVAVGYVPGYAGHVPQGTTSVPPPRSLDKALVVENHRTVMKGVTKHVPRHV